MSAGKLVAQGTLEEFRRSGESRVEVVTPDPGPARTVLERLGLATDAAASVADPADVLVTAAMPDDPPSAEAIVAALVRDGVRVRGFAIRRTSLEQRFVELTGEGFDVVG
jgi:ABC-2 type transport system ATP-binding protein